MAVLIWLGSLAKGGGGGPDMVAHLQTFLAPVKDRLQILNEYKSGALTITMTCQNVQWMFNRTILLTRLQDCRLASWAPSNVRISPVVSEQWMSINTGDKSFLRVLCAYEYNTRQEDIALEHLVFIRKYPDAAPCMVSVRALDELEFDFPYDTARAKAGDGRMALHVMKTGFIPGLKAIADTIPDSKNLDSDGLEEYRSVVRDLFKAGAQADSQTPLVVMVLPMAGLTSNNNM
ncbi:hypothetical protein B0H14DRAFT_2563324 [Mycena olivaceomarginata]|nr:hypothetical protein B0H14DRAFT_2563324 [Mycena olivaceomarginata]